jgi:hypothetical protein
VASCGTTSCSWYSDSPEQFSFLNAGTAAVQVHLVVEGYYSTTTGTVTVTVTNAPAPAGMTCTNAIDLTSASSWTGNFSTYRDNWTRGTGCGYGTGPEVWFTATVAAGNRLTVTETTSGTDVVIHRLTACGTTSCAAYVDEPETMAWTNGGGSAATVWLNIERYSAGTTGAIALTVTNGP